MGITGRYDFTGIQKAVSVGINALLAATTWGAWLLSSPFMPVIDMIEDALINWLANRGLMVLNLGAVMIDGEIDQDKFDSAMATALQQIQQGRANITVAQGKAIDDAVRAAFDQDVDLGAVDPSSQ